jgi:hypothetical protein
VISGNVEGIAVSIDKIFTDYRKTYPARDPDLSRLGSNDELRQLTPAEGLRRLAPPPCSGVVTGSPPYAPQMQSKEKYLWVIGEESIVHALEQLPDVAFQRGYLSHTNLTGGAPAHSGGELWFTTASSIVINGGSGRYQPRSPAELEAVALGFKGVGFRVASMGWDEEIKAPARYLRGTPAWL